MLRNIFIYGTFLFFLSCGGNSDVDHFNDARDYLRDGDYRQALYSINEAIHLDSTNNDFFELRAEIYAHLADTLHFEEDVSHILQTDRSDDERDKHIRGLINWDSHKTNPKAQELIAKELSLYENDTSKHIEVVDFVIRQYLRSDDTLAAKDLCLQTIKSYPKNPNCYEHLATIELAQHDFRDAIVHYKKYLSIDDSNAVILSNLAYCYIQLKNTTQAKKYYKLSADLGNSEACKQYRELTAKTRYYTQSACCDGSTSSSTGRGTCSHHGGVCGIEYVPYKEYTYDCR